MINNQRSSISFFEAPVLAILFGFLREFKLKMSGEAYIENSLDFPKYGRAKRGEMYRATYDGGGRSEKTRMQNRGEYTHNENAYGDEFFGKRCYYEEKKSKEKSKSEEKKKNQEKENESELEENESTRGKLSKEIFEGKNEERMSEESKEREFVSPHVVKPSMSSLSIEEDAPIN
ncbi:hypothetical protein M9H77_07308 [Catharanthus roseus]|uniref:Uncharacterized protein n=1 Tax=Catharanthus roseus TaxID=4058 RepID=A0ACC0BUK8_CATRO|nr:hypothetical protein M9H77_07308 [Catharanthus roseus]